MEGVERDSTQDWVIPRRAVPTLDQLEARIDEALVVARASEDGVREVGEMALDAARQARRAAEAAEKSAEAAVGMAAVGTLDEGGRPAGPVVAAVPGPPLFEVRFRSFTERADRVSARLRALQDDPSHRSGPSVGAARRRGDG